LQGATCVPAFRVITLSDNGGFPSLLKAGIMMLNGVKPTEVRGMGSDCVKTSSSVPRPPSHSVL
jgi:hypothetical protein